MMQSGIMSRASRKLYIAVLLMGVLPTSALAEKYDTAAVYGADLGLHSVRGLEVPLIAIRSPSSPKPLDRAEGGNIGEDSTITPPTPLTLYPHYYRLNLILGADRGGFSASRTVRYIALDRVRVGELRGGVGAVKEYSTASGGSVDAGEGWSLFLYMSMSIKER